MCSVEELQTYAEEHLDWARNARTDRECDIFLMMAQAWLEVVVLRRKGASQVAEGPSRRGDGNSLEQVEQVGTCGHPRTNDGSTI